MEGYCWTGQSPQRAVVPVEEEEGKMNNACSRPSSTIKHKFKTQLDIC
jgi:hypothetical protein